MNTLVLLLLFMTAGGAYDLEIKDKLKNEIAMYVVLWMITYIMLAIIAMILENKDLFYIITVLYMIEFVLVMAGVYLI